jgi:hypothetical protein
MEIESSLINHNGSVLKVLYRDMDSATELEGRTVSGVHAYCFAQDKLVIVYSPQKEHWTPPGAQLRREKLSKKRLFAKYTKRQI